MSPGQFICINPITYQVAIQVRDLNMDEGENILWLSGRNSQNCDAFLPAVQPKIFRCLSAENSVEGENG